MQQFVWSPLTAKYTVGKLLRTFMHIPPFVNYTLFCAGIMSLNHNEYKIMNAITELQNDKNIGCALLEFHLEVFCSRS